MNVVFHLNELSSPPLTCNQPQPSIRSYSLKDRVLIHLDNLLFSPTPSTTTMSIDLDAFCAAALTDESVEAGICSLYATSTTTNEGLNVFYLLFAGALVFMMQAGFAMLCAGSVRQMNVKNILIKNVLDACGGAIAFWSVGYAFAYGGATSDTTRFIGNANFFCRGIEGAGYIGWFFQFAFAASAATIVAGAIAERCKFEAYILYSMMLTGFVYPVVVHSIWGASGFLSAFNGTPFQGVGMHDFAGSGVVHMTGGVTALIAAVILGPRVGRFYDADGIEILDAQPFVPHSVPLQVLGTFILWVGWYGFNPGSTLLIATGQGGIASLAAVTTTIGGASGAISAMVTDMLMYRLKTGEVAYDITMVMNGTLAGLVGVTAGCAMIEPWAAAVIGIVSGWVYIFVSKLLVSLKIDDAVDAIPVHMGAGLWGVIAVGIFAEPDLVASAVSGNGGAGLIYGGKSALIIAQLAGAAWIIGWVSAVMIPFFLCLKFAGLLRVDSIDEEVGLDVSHHKGSAYDLTAPTEESMNKYELHKSQRKLEIPNGIKEEDDERASDGVPASEADYNAFVNAVKNK